MAKRVTTENPTKNMVCHTYAIFGEGESASDDLASIVEEFVVVGVEGNAITCPSPISLWASYNGVPADWDAIRAEQDIEEEYTKISWFQTSDSSSVQVPIAGGGSALWASLAVLACDPEAKVIFCGCDVPEGNLKARRGWERALPKLQGKAEGISGYPKELLG